MERSSWRANLIAFSLTLIFMLAVCPISNRQLIAPFHPRYVSSSVESIPVDHDLWMAGKARHRVGMARYLANHKVLDGKSRSELVEMLGEPDAEQPGDEGSRWLLGYVAKGMFDEWLWLELTIGEDGTAHGAGVGVSWGDYRER